MGKYRFPSLLTFCVPWLLSGLVLMSALGCQFAKPFRTITPSQYLSGEHSREANAAKEGGQLDEAERRFEYAIRYSKKDPELRRQYAEVLWEQGKTEQALKELAVAEHYGGTKNVLLQLSYAEKLIASNNPMSAFRRADNAVRLDPQQSRAWALRGHARWQIAVERLSRNEMSGTDKWFEQAQTDYYTALGLFPDDKEKRVMLKELAQLQMFYGGPEHALATWQHLEEMYSQGNEPTELFTGKAEAYLALKRVDDAIDYLTKAQQRLPEDRVIRQQMQRAIAMKTGQVIR